MRATLSIRVFVGFIVVNTSLCREYFRCRDFLGATGDVSWKGSTCEKCIFEWKTKESAAVRDRTVQQQPPAHHGLTMFLDGLTFIHDKETFEAFLTIAAGLVTLDSNVSIHYYRYTYTLTPTKLGMEDSVQVFTHQPLVDFITESIFAKVPCERRRNAASRFIIREVSVEVASEHALSFLCSSVHCQLRHSLLKTTFLDKDPVLLEPQTGMFVASAWDIASVVLAEYHQVPLLVVLDPSKDERATQELLPTLKSAQLGDGWSRRWQTWLTALDHTHLFLSLNRWRVNRLGLPRLRHITETWKRGTKVLPTPLVVPPCVPCVHPPLDASQHPTVLLRLSMTDTTSSQRLLTRRLFQGLEMARVSLGKHCQTRVCKLSSFHIIRVVVPGETEESLRLFPESVTTETSYMMDSFVRHNPLALITTDCNVNKSTRDILPIPLLCVDETAVAREVALRLLFIIHELEKTDTKIITDELWQVVHIIKNMHHNEPHDGVAASEGRIELAFHELDRHNTSNTLPTVIVILAWLVITVLVVASLPVIRPYRSRAYTSEFGAEILSRWAEMDWIVDASVQWVSQHGRNPTTAVGTNKANDDGSHNLHK